MLTLNKYGIFIITYKRANNIKTLNTLKSGDVYQDWHLVVADDDPELDEYIGKYKNKVLVFSREEAFKKTDSVDNIQEKIGSVYPKNIINDFAKKLNYDYYIVLDDDYIRFSYRRCFGDVLRTFKIKRLGEIRLQTEGYECLFYENKRK